MTIYYAKKISMIDTANERSSHIGQTYRGGGILFIIFFYVGVITAWSIGYIQLTSFLITLLVCSLFIAVVGWFDDFKNLSARMRFLIQIVLATVSICFLDQLWPNIPILIEKFFLILAWVWFINLYNFMDGADGFSAQETIFICGILFLLLGANAYILAILGCAILGFLRVNYPKAHIFMGDIGSLFLGFILGGFLLYIVSNNHLSAIDAILVTSLFSFDATYTLIKRVIKKKKFWQAHREHWYQRLLITGFSHKQLFWVGVLYNFLVLMIFWYTQNIHVIYRIILVLILWLIYIRFILGRERQNEKKFIKK
ncbi:glycosyltransferase family 4 protein [Thiotrichales bacterium 19S9-11]|nr:glycosyltransferase family 4 protein [Thiotrichales bacterium 19S9-11]